MALPFSGFAGSEASDHRRHPPGHGRLGSEIKAGGASEQGGKGIPTSTPPPGPEAGPSPGRDTKANAIGQGIHAAVTPRKQSIIEMRKLMRLVANLFYSTARGWSAARSNLETCTDAHPLLCPWICWQPRCRAASGNEGGRTPVPDPSDFHLPLAVLAVLQPCRAQRRARFVVGILARCSEAASCFVSGFGGAACALAHFGHPSQRWRDRLTVRRSGHQHTGNVFVDLLSTLRVSMDLA